MLQVVRSGCFGVRKIEMWADVKELVNARMQEITMSENEGKVGIIICTLQTMKGKTNKNSLKY